MGKMILYWKSNSKTELGFYGINQEKNIRLSDEEINIRIAEAFAEVDDEEYNAEPISTHKVISSDEIIPEDNCRVIIENIWIDKFVDLSHRLITDGIGNIPLDILDDLDDNMVDDEVNNSEVISDSMQYGRGVFDYNINDLISGGDDEDDDNDDNDNNNNNADSNTNVDVYVDIDDNDNGGNGRGWEDPNGQLEEMGTVAIL